MRHDSGGIKPIYSIIITDNNKPESQFADLIASTFNRSNRIRLVLITMQNGGSYEGEWLNGKRDGNGKYVWPDGSYYEGDWISDKAHGQGKLGNN